MSFNKITAIIREDVLEEVEKKLSQLGARGISLSKIRGYGEYANLYRRDITVDHVKIEIFTIDTKVDKIVAGILETAHTGLSGDGIVTVQPVEKIFRVRTRAEITHEDV